VLPTQLEVFIKKYRTGKGIRSFFYHQEIKRNLLNAIIYLEYEKYLQEKLSFSEFSLFMYVFWESRWVSLDLCTRMLGFYFTLCLPPGNARWKNEAEKSPEFCHFTLERTVGNERNGKNEQNGKELGKLGSFAEVRKSRCSWKFLAEVGKCHLIIKSNLRYTIKLCQK